MCVYIYIYTYTYLSMPLMCDGFLEVLKPLLEAEGPFEEVGPGSCRDAQGNLSTVLRCVDTIRHCLMGKGCQECFMFLHALFVLTLTLSQI